MSLLLRGCADELRTGFSLLCKPQDVAALLDVPYDRLKYHLYIAKDKKRKRYAKFTIPKRRGGVREISAPISALKILQSKLNQVLMAVYERKPCVHGFAKERNVLSNAKVHVRRRYVLNVDLLDFFPSINFGRVRGLFMARPYSLPAEAATVLAQICCHDNALPQGAPTSPVVSNMICAKLDSNLIRLAHANRCSYTRYADDLTFSTNLPQFPSGLARKVETDSGSVTEVGRDLEHVIRENGFEVNTAKVTLRTARERQEVTGITTNEKLNLPRKYVRQIRAMLHAWDKFGIEEAEREFHEKYNRKHRPPFKEPPRFVQVVEGKLAYLAMVRGRHDGVVLRFQNQFAALKGCPIQQGVIDWSQPSWRKRLFQSIWVVESCDDETISQGTAFCLKGLGIVTCWHALGRGNYVYKPALPDEKEGPRYAVSIKQCDPNLDLAILEAEIPGVVYLRAETGQVSVDQDIILAGYPNAPVHGTGALLRGTVTEVRRRSGLDVILLSTPVAKGHSGAPVLNAAGRVIGIASRGPTGGSDAECNEAIPVDRLRSLTNQGQRA